MNVTLKRFGFPDSVVAEFEHWVLMIRPQQPTPYCCVVAARSDTSSLGGLTPTEAAELPSVIRCFEASVRAIAPAIKFNYAALMMVDPNPHFHAIPRYAQPAMVDGVAYHDSEYPRPPVWAGLPEAAPNVRRLWAERLAAEVGRIKGAGVH